MVCGGIGGSNNNIVRALRETLWMALPPMRNGRFDHVGSTVGERPVVAGGYRAGYLNNAEYFDANDGGGQWVELPSMPRRVCQAASVGSSHWSFYVFGGLSDTNPLDQVVVRMVFPLARRSWTGSLLIHHSRFLRCSFITRVFLFSAPRSPLAQLESTESAPVWKQVQR